jgi:hypothetical protein
MKPKTHIFQTLNPRKPYFKPPKNCMSNPQKTHVSNPKKPYFKPLKNPNQGGITKKEPIT